MSQTMCTRNTHPHQRAGGATRKGLPAWRDVQTGALLSVGGGWWVGGEVCGVSGDAAAVPRKREGDVSSSLARGCYSALGEARKEGRGDIASAEDAAKPRKRRAMPGAQLVVHVGRHPAPARGPAGRCVFYGSCKSSSRGEDRRAPGKKEGARKRSRRKSILVIW